MKTQGSTLLPLLLTLALGCTDKLGGDDSAAADTQTAVCGDPVDHPHDASKPEWSYHDAEDGPDMWGELEGYETCGTGTAQTPIDIPDSATVADTQGLVFSGYDAAIPLDLLNNGHTLQVNYTGTQSATDPQITYDGKTYYLIQLHGHSTSEHTLDGTSYAMELHFVHQATDSSLAVVGVFLEEGEENSTVATLLERNPGHELEVSCDDTVDLAATVPTESGFYHYEGSLTTPGCTEGVSWFVMQSHGAVSTEQEEEWQTDFGGTTNRPVQPLNGRTIFKYSP